jgi:hypothetical protein
MDEAWGVRRKVRVEILRSDLGKKTTFEVERRFPGMIPRSRIIGSDLARGPI